MEYTVDGLKYKGYKGYIKDTSTGLIQETDTALLRVAVLANYARHMLRFSIDEKNQRRRVEVIPGLYLPENQAIWAEKNLREEVYSYD